MAAQSFNRCSTKPRYVEATRHLVVRRLGFGTASSGGARAIRPGCGYQGARPAAPGQIWHGIDRLPLDCRLGSRPDSLRVTTTMA